MKTMQYVSCGRNIRCFKLCTADTTSHYHAESVSLYNKLRKGFKLPISSAFVCFCVCMQTVKYLLCGKLLPPNCVSHLGGFVNFFNAVSSKQMPPGERLWELPRVVLIGTWHTQGTFSQSPPSPSHCHLRIMGTFYKLNINKGKITSIHHHVLVHTGTPP